MNNFARTLRLAALCIAAVCGNAGEPVKFRGIFINDEDWGIRPWAVRQFGEDEQLGIRAYEAVFKLMQSNGLNLLWPAMHEGGYEFASRPENMALAAKYGIYIGTSHCEPMLRNNCYLPQKDRHLWSWLKHPDFIKNYWQWSVDCYATNKVLWTIGMRGIHDGKMRDGNTTAEKIAVLEDVFKTQCEMLEKAGAGSAPKLFVPYKEVLPIFNAGLKVPEDATIMWVNDNFGYIRRLGGPQCDGYGGGIYWHVGYLGRPHGYLQLCTTPPAFMWYELVAKCSQNGARDVWMVNVGDVFQAEIAIYALGRFAADPDYWVKIPDAQNRILEMWAENEFGKEYAARIARHLAEYYNLGFIRKPEFMCIQWTNALPDSMKSSLKNRYHALLGENETIEALLPEKLRDKFFLKVGFQAKFLAYSGIIHLEGRDKDFAHSVLDKLRVRWSAIDNGKWAGFWCDTIDERGGNRWSSQMQWPWNEPVDANGESTRKDYPATAYAWDGKNIDYSKLHWLEPDSNIPANEGAWVAVQGLGTSGSALALLPVKPGIGKDAAIEYTLPHDGGKRTLVLQFLPDFSLWPGMKLRVKIAFDGKDPVETAVPRSDSNIGEKDPVRNAAVQDNFIRVRIPIPADAKTAKIFAVDPGVVIDAVGVADSAN